MDKVQRKVKDDFTAGVAEKITALQNNIETVIKGKSEVVQLCLIGLLARGHILIEDIPGVGKSTLAHCIAMSLGLSFQRIQFTSDLLPSDILGVTIYDERTREFMLRKGPIFSNIVLADEINRSTPKTQSALLEAMNERQVTIDTHTHHLEAPFMVMATQNPVEHRGTFPLPESQLDRFLLRVRMGYPGLEFEREILRKNTQPPQDRQALRQIISRDELLEMQSAVDGILLAEGLETYLLKIVDATRQSDLLALGASTRGALAFAQAAKARALLQGRAFCLPDDVKALAVAVLSHRVMVEQRAGSVGAKSRRTNDAEDVIAEIVGRIPVPV